MKKPKMPDPVKLPYASTIASFFGDQGAAQGNSFLGRMFKGGGRMTQSQSQAPAVRPTATSPLTSFTDRQGQDDR